MGMRMNELYSHSSGRLKHGVPLSAIAEGRGTSYCIGEMSHIADLAAD